MTKNQLRVERTFTQTYHATKDEVFPLLCPVREKEWLDGWDYEMVYSESGLAEKGCVFKTHGTGKDATVWVIDQYNRENHQIHFTRMTPDRTLVQLEVVLEEVEPGLTKSKIKYIITVLSDEGAEYIKKHFTEAIFVQQMKWWEKSLNYYLKTGSLLKLTDNSLLKH